MATPELDAGCYVYKPDSTNAQSSTANVTPSTFPSGRLESFNRVWQPVDSILQSVLSAADTSSVTKICSYLTTTNPKLCDRIPTGLITTSTAGSLFSAVRSSASKDILFINIPASQCTNLKSVLKCIASSVTLKSSVRLLNYDLDALKIFMEDEHYVKVVLYFGNGENLHGGVLSDLVDVLESYRGRIPMVLVFETAVSIDLFQEKLTMRARGQLRGTAFSTASASEVVESVFESLMTDDSGCHRLFMGPNLAQMLMDRQAEQMQSASTFVQEIKYMYMVHFHRNALSTLLDEEGSDVSLDAIDAVRQTKSFKAYIEELKANKAGKLAITMNNDETLKARLRREFSEGPQLTRELLEAARVLKIIHDHAAPKGVLPWSRLYIQAMSDQLVDSTLENTKTALLATPSNAIIGLLQALTGVDSAKYESFHTELQSLIEKYDAKDEPLRTQHDPSHETTKTTVSARKKITLSKHKAVLSERDEAYTAFVEGLAEQVFEPISQRLFDPKTLLFNETFIFDLRVPIREAFAPRPRYALEHALTIPGAYLACECCDPDQRVLSSSQPATAILYQLYLESGAIVNIADLWAAFNAMATSGSGTNGGDNEEQDETKLALFYRALAELRYLGMIKSSRKRADHLVKMRFIGL